MCELVQYRSFSDRMQFRNLPWYKGRQELKSVRLPLHVGMLESRIEQIEEFLFA